MLTALGSIQIRELNTMSKELCNMVNYDPTIIHQHASRLYSRADSLVILYGLMFAFFGLIGSVMFVKVVDVGGIGLAGAAINALIFALIGAAFGRARGFELRLQAQIALCQVQIELNSRVRAPVHPPTHQAPTHQAQGWTA